MNGRDQNVLIHVEQVMRILVEIRNEGKILILDLYQSQLSREISRNHSMTCQKISGKLREILNRQVYKLSFFVLGMLSDHARSRDNDPDTNL